MAKTELNSNKKIKVEEDSASLKGTLASVFLLGFFIIVSWVSVYFLFVERF
ncbi:MAG TPA: cytochrome c oxidase subunit 2A [Pseudoneobacillus sp.]|nr:cytochrome c oxidase subunit 2A [Pseudoneobacillus sp.]